MFDVQCSQNSKAKCCTLPACFSHSRESVTGNRGVLMLFVPPIPCRSSYKDWLRNKEVLPRLFHGRLCHDNHGRVFVECTGNAVQKISFFCGKTYIGQAGRWRNTTLRENHSFLRATPSGYFAVHVRDCPDGHFFLNTRDKLKHTKARDIKEAFHISRRGGSSYASVTCLAFTVEEFQVLK